MTTQSTNALQGAEIRQLWEHSGKLLGIPLETFARQWIKRHAASWRAAYTRLQRAPMSWEYTINATNANNLRN